MLFKDIVAGLTQQTSRKHAEMKKVMEERNKLLGAYQRYRELDAHIEPDAESMKIAMALVFSADSTGDELGSEQLREIVSKEAIDSEELDVNSYYLWKVMREILRQVTEMRVYELKDHLRRFGIDTSRSAIESALSRHRKQFAITRRGREKYVACKSYPVIVHLKNIHYRCKCGNVTERPDFWGPPLTCICPEPQFTKTGETSVVNPR